MGCQERGSTKGSTEGLSTKMESTEGCSTKWIYRMGDKKSDQQRGVQQRGSTDGVVKKAATTE